MFEQKDCTLSNFKKKKKKIVHCQLIFARVGHNIRGIPSLWRNMSIASTNKIVHKPTPFGSDLRTVIAFICYSLFMEL